MNRPAILLVGNYSNRTGYAWNNIYRLFNVIAVSMQQRGIGVSLSFAQLEPPVQFMDNNIAFNSFEYDPMSMALKNLYSLAKAIKVYRIKYVYFTDHRSVSWLYLFLRILGVKRILVHSRVSVADPYPAKPEKGVQRLAKTMVGKISWITPDKIYAVSNFVRNRLIHKNCLPEKKVITIINGIDIDKFRCGKSVTVSSKIRIFTGARANKYKGMLVLIQATYLLLHKHKVENFIIEYAGDGPDLNKFMLEVKKLGLEQHFIFLGELIDTRDQICHADIVVVPSVWGDACPSSVSEALAAGKPLITTMAGGIPEIVGNRSNAVLVPPHDEEALAKELAELIIDGEKRRNLGIKARLRATDTLDEKHYYNKMINQLMSDLL